MSKPHLELTLIPTTDCSLKCNYCCIYDSLNQGSMHLEDSIKFLSWQLDIESNKDREVIIEFFGGEPTMNWSYIKDILNYVKTNYSYREITFRIYTNGIWNNEVTKDLETWKIFDDIILSIDSTSFEDNIHRTESKKLHQKSLDSLILLLENNCNVGVAFVVHPFSDVDKTFSNFIKMFPNLRYFHFEIASLWNDDKSNNIDLKFLYNTFKIIYDKILLYNINNIHNYYLFSIPKEFLSSKNYYTSEKRFSCFDTNRALSLNGNIYACRDLAVSEYHLSLKSSDDNVFFRTNNNVVKPFNIRDLQLNKELDIYSNKVKEYDLVTPCFVKDFEFKHLAGIDPIWFKDENFQDIIIKPIFELMNDTFYIYHHNKNQDSRFFDYYKNRVLTYGKVLEAYEQYL